MSTTKQEIDKLASEIENLFAKFRKIVDGDYVSSSEESDNDIESEDKADGGFVATSVKESSEQSDNVTESDKGEASGLVEECVQDTQDDVNSPTSESSDDFFFFFGDKPVINNPKAISAEIEEELNVSRFDENNVETRKIIRQMKNFLYQKCAMNGRKPIVFYRFIFDPQSFSRTIENIFHVSRLVEYGDVLLERDVERGALVLLPNHASLLPRHRSTVPAGQLLMEMSKDDWIDLRAEFEVNEDVFKPTLD